MENVPDLFLQYLSRMPVKWTNYSIYAMKSKVIVWTVYTLMKSKSDIHTFKKVHETFTVNTYYGCFSSK